MSARTPSVWSRLLKNKTLLVGIAIVAVFAILALFSEWLSPHNPLSQNIRARFSPPSAQYWLGTDNLGRDIFSRIVWGSQVSLIVGILAVGVGASLGVMAGMISGFFGGVVDDVIMRIADTLLALPTILMALVIVAMMGSASVFSVVVAIGIANTPRFARIVRAEVLSVRKLDYVSAAVALGASRSRLMIRHILPNTFTSIVVLSTLRVAQAITTEASLSFLGFGPQAPTITWGAMISTGRDVLRTTPWVPLAPGLAIMLLVIGFSLLGDGLRDYLDPKSRQQRGR
jgi:peptide/nickel transport system permease protein